MRGQLSKEQRQQQVITRLKNENIRLREELKDAFKKIILLEEENQKLKQKLEKAFLLIEELQRMVFGKGKKKDTDKDKDDNDLAGNNQRKRAERDSASYRRETPKEEKITREECHSEEICQHCSHKLTKLKKLEFYTEDILRITRNITGLTI